MVESQEPTDPIASSSKQQMQDATQIPVAVELGSNARMQLMELARVREARRAAQQDHSSERTPTETASISEQLNKQSNQHPEAEKQKAAQQTAAPQIYEEVKYDPNKEGLELNHGGGSQRLINVNNMDQEEENASPHFGHVGRPQYLYDTGGTQQQQQNMQANQEMQYGATNFMGHPYRDLRLDEDINMTNAQTVLFVILNFSMAVMLLVAVNCNMQNSCGTEMKYWLVIFSLVLAMGSLVSVMGMDIDRQKRLMRQIHNGCKLAQYLLSVSWLIYGNYIAFIDNDTCPNELPWLSMTMMVTLFFGWIQLIMFIVFAGGILIWALCRLCGKEVSFTPQSLWRDQQQFFDRDPEHSVNEQNKQILKNLEEIVFGEYRREICADMKYGFQQGDPNYWREYQSNESSYKQVDEMGVLKRVGRPECAVCMEKFNEKELISPLPCHVNHLFHTACIRPWLLQNRNCPLCKREVDPIELTNVSGSFIMNQTITNTTYNNSSQMSLINARQYSSSYSSNRINMSQDNADVRISGASSSTAINNNNTGNIRPFQRYI